MKEKTIEEINEIYNLELDKVVSTIKKEKVKKVLLQFPEGMKPYALQISKFLEEKTNALFFIWMGSCFGACDLPLEVEKLGIELIIQFGHSPWRYEKKKIKVLNKPD